MPFLSPSTKKTLGIVLFSMAKAFQYSGLAIVGVEGYKRLKNRMLNRSEIQPVTMPRKKRQRKRRSTLKRRKEK